MDNIEKLIKVSQKEPFFTDRRRLLVILNNLISNSIKYADYNNKQPYVQVTVKCNAQQAIISVKDNGIGMSKKVQGHVFEMFYRASSLGAGSGLGLYIVKDVVNKLKGNIQVESEQHKGSTFVVTIPNLDAT